MLNAAIRQVALHILVYSIRECIRDPRRCDPDEDEQLREVMRFFWDYKFLHKYGIVIDPLPLPDLKPNFSEVPMHHPKLISERLAIHEELLFELVEVVAGDPSPQPNVFSVLNNQHIRLEAARSLAKRLEVALDQVKAEIEQLSKASQK